MKPNFDRIARPYRWLEYLTLGRALERTRTAHLAACAGSRCVLAMGDGDGRFTAALLARAPQAQVLAVDLSPAMLALLTARAHASPRLRTRCEDARTAERWPAADLIVTHFFLDCLSQAETDALVPRLARALEPGGLWVVSEFRIPPGPLALPARLLVRLLYAAFRVLTGLRVTALPDHAGALTRAGLQRIAESHRLGGLLTAELWQRPEESASAEPEENFQSPGNRLGNGT